MTERWKDIPGYEGRYFISDHGRVKSVRYVKSRKEYTTRYLKLRPGKKGHLRVSLLVDGVAHEHRVVHQLVLEAFVGPRPLGAHGLHWDDNPENNHVSNLRWGTGSENMYDRVRNGKHQMSSKEVCKRGHPLKGNNLYASPEPNASRQCRSCRLARARNKKDETVDIQMEANKIFNEVYA